MNPIRQITLALLTAALLAGITTTATADPVTQRVTVGGDTSPGTVPFTATTDGITLDTPFNMPMACGASSLTGTLERGDTVPGNGIAAITASTWNDCQYFFNTLYDVTQTNTWSLDATNVVGGVVEGAVTNIVQIEVRSQIPGVCNFDVSGDVQVSLDGNSQELSLVDPDDEYPLTISNVSGCFGELLDDDPMQMAAVYDLSTPGGDITFEASP